MIDPKELRIGNWVCFEQYPDSHSQVDYQLLSGKIGIWSDPDIYSPIPLTPEWLERLGFKLSKAAQEVYGYELWELNPEVNSSMEGIGFVNSKMEIYQNEDKEYYDGENYVVLKSVHQLQNLFFALTSEEL